MLLYLLVLLFFHTATCQTTEGVTRRIESNQPCKQNSDCGLNSFCFIPQLKCKCDDGYVLETKGTSYECLPIADTIHFSPCKIDIQCIITLGSASICESSEKRCECKEGAHYDRGQNRCYETKALNETCVEDRQCLLPDNSYAFCNAGKCSCAFSQYLSEDGRCIIKTALGDVCIKDENCAHVDGICNSVCKCGTGRVASDNGTVCLKAASKYGDNCTQLSQCTEYLDERSICSEGTCTCPLGTHSYGLKCFNSLRLGDSCFDSRECYNDGLGKKDVDCLTGVCKCISDACKSEPDPNSSNYVESYIGTFVFSLILLAALM